MRIWLWRLGLLLIALTLWEAVASMLNPILYVGPSRLPGALARVLATRDLPPLAGHVWLTMGEIAVAYVLAVAGGLWVGFLLGLRHTVGRIYEPLLATLYAVPSVVWYPSLMLCFGLGPASKIAFGFFLGFFPVTLAVLVGELLGARAGLGYVINYAYGLMMTAEYAALVVLVAAAVLLLDGAGALIEARVKRWAG